ncbi:hypothetical protein [Georgenia deserti]|uniref:Septum formation-related domain-containing protein n=1 Tax=Georgenia deserti TaxID=2093781 RepID=A0ABW4KZK8_9MICO
MIAALVAAGVALVVGVTFIGFQLVPDGSEPAPTADPGGDPPPPADGHGASPEDQEAPTAGGGPAPCYPPNEIPLCFPDENVGAAMVEQIQQLDGWECLVGDETDENGDSPLGTAECSLENIDGYNFGTSQSIGYVTADYEVGSPVTGFDVSAQAYEAEYLDQAATAQDAMDRVDEFFPEAVSYIWPEDEALQREAVEAFAQAQEQCRADAQADAGGGEPPDPTDADPNVTVTTPSGYEVSCSAPTTISVQGESGVVTSYTQAATIEAPTGY